MLSASSAAMHRRVNRRHRARMAAGEGDQILVGFLDDAEPLAQVRDRPLFELDHPSHRAPSVTRRRFNFAIADRQLA